jgi:hypothetical protein
MNMQPSTITEQLMYTTIRLVVPSNNGCGTGFFFRFSYGESLSVPIIVTNKHVVNYKVQETVQFLVHTDMGESGVYNNLTVNLSTDWYQHPTHDLCFCFAQPLINEIKRRFGKDIVYKSINDNLIWTKNKLTELSAVEEVTMVGYPNGLWDSKNNFPIFRHGYTATHPAIDISCTVDNRQYDGSVGLVDIACFGGSSGSPLLIINELGFNDKKGNFVLGSKRIVLLGIEFASPQINANGEIVVRNIPTQQVINIQTAIPINLGYYIHAYELLAFRPMVEKMAQIKEGSTR